MEQLNEAHTALRHAPGQQAIGRESSRLTGVAAVKFKGLMASVRIGFRPSMSAKPTASSAAIWPLRATRVTTPEISPRSTKSCMRLGIVSPNEANEYSHTVIIAPMTTTERSYPTRVGITFQQRHGQVALDQIRSVDRQRLVRKLGTAPARTAQAVSSVLVEMFTR
jgi:mRNA interferase MazF